MKPKEYLRLHYHHVFVWDETSQTWTGTVKEFSGCIAQGDSIQSCWISLYITALDWIAAALDLGQEIPEPEES
jgi:predicted RNase H-like HicB family nuclease